MAKVKALCRRTGTSLPLDTLLIGLNQMLRGWCEYFRPGVSSATFQVREFLCVEASHEVAQAQAPQNLLEGTAPPLLRRAVVARLSRGPWDLRWGPPRSA
ncbi:MAG TPA: group II intron maturase-specific domain-containing protein [Actinomycetes bacterium]|nr:group II intron maturase-specific domain-containing protein [Actinomycetes bacterium]